MLDRVPLRGGSIFRFPVYRTLRRGDPQHPKSVHLYSAPKVEYLTLTFSDIFAKLQRSQPSYNL